MRARACAALLLFLGGCGAAPAADRLLAELPPEADGAWWAVGAGGRGWAWTELRGSDAYVVLNGRLQGPFP
jgi:hypothetical protein